MSKTINTLNVGDKLLFPTVSEIKEIEIIIIEKTWKGIRIGSSNYNIRLDDSDFNAAISPIATFKNKEIVCYLRMEDAIAEQNKLQNATFIKLQNEANFSLQKLNDFTLKYFVK